MTINCIYKNCCSMCIKDSKYVDVSLHVTFTTFMLWNDSESGSDLIRPYLRLTVW